MKTRLRAWMLGSFQDIVTGATDGHKGNDIHKDICNKNVFMTYTEHIFYSNEGGRAVACKSGKRDRGLFFEARSTLESGR